MKLIVGLGNPGKEYLKTRHNVGFMILDQYLGSDNWKEKFDGLYQLVTMGNEKVLFLKPLTYMNLSGNSVIKAVKYYNISIEDILVIQDDLDIMFGKYRLKKNSSHGGHNGIKSILSTLNSNQFARLKIGIKSSFNKDAIDIVLGKFSNLELEWLSSHYATFSKIIESFVFNGIDQTMNDYNH